MSTSEMDTTRSQFRLMIERRFAPLWLCNVFGEFSNQLTRAAAAGLLVGYTAGAVSAGELRGLAAMMFVVPAMIAAPYAGQLADGIPGHRLVRYSRLFGVAGALLAALGLWYELAWAVITGLCITAIQASIFGPVRGVLVRRHLADSELTDGTGLMTAGWQLTAVAALVIGLLDPVYRSPAIEIMAILLIAAAAVGWLASLAIPETDPADTKIRYRWSPPDALRCTLLRAVAERGIFLAILGVSWFWFTSLTYMIYLPDFAATFHAADRDAGLAMLAVLLVGIAIGALLCVPLSGRRVELGLVPLGAIGILVTGVDFYMSAPALGSVGHAVGIETLIGNGVYRRHLADLFLMGLATGFYVVPLYAVILQQAASVRLGRVLGGMYLFNLIFISVSLAASEWLRRQGVPVSALMLITTLLHAAASIYIFLLLPEFLLRLVMWVLVHTIYRVRTTGLENIPNSGAAVLVCNHVTYMDPLLIGARVRRPIRFVMHKHIFQIPLLATLFRLNKAIPIASAKTDPEGLKLALDRVASELEAGQLVVIFPEGHLTHDGDIDTFRTGIEQIIARTPVPVIPLAVQGMWGSFFSNCGGTALTHWPRFGWSKVGLVAGEAVQPDAVSAADLQARVQALRGENR
jgi:1-acyl-sn-glycerol-3-phosphate acyltransferase